MRHKAMVFPVGEARAFKGINLGKDRCSLPQRGSIFMNKWNGFIGRVLRGPEGYLRAQSERKIDNFFPCRMNSDKGEWKFIHFYT